jgi:hypothetical protein
MLDGAIDSPRFNLRNAPMIAKHVHSAVLTTLFGLASGRVAGVDGAAKDRLTDALNRCLPTFVKSYLFDDAGNVRAVPFDVGPLRSQISLHREVVLREVRRVFESGWPLEDGGLVHESALGTCIDAMATDLSDVIARLRVVARRSLRHSHHAPGRIP